MAHLYNNGDVPRAQSTEDAESDNFLCNPRRGETPPSVERAPTVSGIVHQASGWTPGAEFARERLIVVGREHDNGLLVLQRLFKEGCTGMREVRLGAWRGSAWPVRYYPAYPRATATTHPARTVPGAAFPAPPGRPAAS